MVKGEWTFAVEDLGPGLFEPVEVSDEDLENAGILHIDPSILVAFQVVRYEVQEEAQTCSATVVLVFQAIALEPRAVRTPMTIEDCPLDSVAFLRRVGNTVCDCYEKARALLQAPGLGLSKKD